MGYRQLNLAWCNGRPPGETDKGTPVREPSREDDAADIRVAHSDTNLAADGGGTYASRTAVLGGSATTIAADKIMAKAKKIAAHAMEAGEADIEFSSALFRVVGTDRAVGEGETGNVGALAAL
jgi:CO/xanthine dehydrogenase Mo-binding subunit